MSSKKVYVLYVLVLGGCSNIMYRHSMYGSEENSNNYTPIVSNNKKNNQPLQDEKSKLKSLSDTFKYICNNIDYFRSWITESLIQYATRANEESKHDPERAIELFRIYMHHILPYDLNAHVEDSLISKLLNHVNAVNNVIFSNFNKNVNNSLIGKLYNHINAAHRNKCAKTCADAIADMTINMLRSAMDESSLPIESQAMCSCFLCKKNNYLRMQPFRITWKETAVAHIW